MRKLKLLLMAAAMLCGAANGWAATDITTTYLRNADLSTIASEWTLGGTNDMGKGYYENWVTNGDVPVVEFYSKWNSGAAVSFSPSKEFKFSQTVTMPAGYYRLAVNAFYRNGGGDGTNNDKAWIFVKGTGIDKSQNVVALTSAGVGGYTGSNDLYKAANAFSRGDFSNAFDFHLSASTEVEIGFQGYFNLSLSWCILGPVKLYEYTADDYMEDYRAKVDVATPLLTQKMNAAIFQALQDAIVEESTLTTVDDVQNAVSTLTNAINDANNSIASYTSLKSAIDAYDNKCTLLDSYGIAAADAAGAANAKSAYTNGTATDGSAEKAALDAAYTAGVLGTKQPGNGLDMTPYVTNPDFNSGNYDGWTRITPYQGNCTIQGGSRMEYWAGNSTNRAEACFDIYQELTNLPAGVYKISADMYNSLNDEGGDYTVFSPTCGVYGSSSNEEVALVNVEGTNLNPYTTGEVLVFSGHLRIGTKNTITPMAARWFVFDNVKLTYARQLTAQEIAANKVPESITLDPTSVNMTIYETQNITATISPAEATDQSITWTSNNPAVATVGNGVITAVGVGTVTITASANGADNVTATATITVADVTPAAAPAYYSEISDGEFYIVNAATGKYLGGANDWGTHASIIEHGIPFTVTASDGKYTLDSETYNVNKHSFDGSYIDAASTPLYITALTDGKYSISTANGSAFVTAHKTDSKVDNSAVNASSTLAQWYFVSKANRDALFAAATSENPADATYYIKDANFSRNYKNGWTGAFNRGGNNDNMNAMVQNATADVYQIIESIPNGTYTLKVQAVTSGTAKFYANDVEMDIESKDDVTSQSIASNAFGAGFFKRNLTVTVTDHTLTVGVKSDDTDKVLYFDNFELFYTPFIISEDEKWDNTISCAGTVTLNRTIKAGYNTLVLPFSMTQAEVEDEFGKGSIVYVVKSYDEDKDNISFTTHDGISANMPCLLDAKVAGTSYTFENRTIVAGEPVADGKNVTMMGTYEEILVPTDNSNYIISAGKIYEVDGQSQVSLKGTRAYITIDSANGARTLTMSFDDTATGIATLKDGKLEFETGDIYDLSGRKVKNPTKGIYLMNGKKVIK